MDRWRHTTARHVRLLLNDNWHSSTPRGWWQSVWAMGSDWQTALHCLLWAELSWDGMEWQARCNKGWSKSTLDERPKFCCDWNARMTYAVNLWLAWWTERKANIEGWGMGGGEKVAYLADQPVIQCQMNSHLLCYFFMNDMFIKTRSNSFQECDVSVSCELALSSNELYHCVVSIIIVGLLAVNRYKAFRCIRRL